MTKQITKISLATLLTSSSAIAIALPGVNNPGGGTIIQEGKLKMVYKNISMKRDKMFNASSEVANTKKLDANPTMHILALRYGFLKGMDLTLAIPYKDFKATAKLGVNDVVVDNKGLGDIVVMANKSLATIKDNGYSLSAGVGIKLPTGDTNKKFVKAPTATTGEIAPLPSQLGTGEYEYKAMVGYTNFLNDLRFDTNAIYTYRPKAKNDYDFGNELKVDLSLVKPITKTVNLGIEYNYKYNTKTSQGNDTTAAARANLPMKAFSGSAGYVTPQIQFVPFDMPKVHVDLGVSFLTNYNLKEEQPLERKRVVFRIGYLF